MQQLAHCYNQSSDGQFFAFLHLQKSGIPVPLHIIVDRDSLSGDDKDPAGFVETEDYVELNGM